MFIKIDDNCVVNTDYIQWVGKMTNDGTRIKFTDGSTIDSTYPFDSICTLLNVTAKLTNTVSCLNIQTRSINCLIRAGYHTIGQAADAFHDRDKVQKIRNLGIKSAREVYIALWKGGYLSREVNPFGFQQE